MKDEIKEENRMDALYTDTQRRRIAVYDSCRAGRALSLYGRGAGGLNGG